MKPLRVGLFDIKGEELYVQTDENNTTSWNGMAWVLLHDLFKFSRIPFTLINGDELVQYLPGNKTFDQYTACIKMLDSNLLDFCPLFLTYSEKRSEIGHFLRPRIETVTYSGFVAKDEDVSRWDVWGVFRAFEGEVWLATLIALMVVSALCGLAKMVGRRWEWRRLLREVERFVLLNWGELWYQGRVGDECESVRFRFRVTFTLSGRSPRDEDGCYSEKIA